MIHFISNRENYGGGKRMVYTVEASMERGDIRLQVGDR